MKQNTNCINKKGDNALSPYLVNLKSNTMKKSHDKCIIYTYNMQIFSQ